MEKREDAFDTVHNKVRRFEEISKILEPQKHMSCILVAFLRYNGYY